ncbi:MAG: TonB family protein [Pseudomonadota bacterium]
MSMIMALPATSAHAGDMEQWKKSVMTTIAKQQRYPRSAQVRSIEGAAKVRLVIDASGSIGSYEFIETTGHKILDKEVEKILTKVTQLPAPPSGNELKVVIPLVWRLQ